MPETRYNFFDLFNKRNLPHLSLSGRSKWPGADREEWQIAESHHSYHPLNVAQI